MAGNWYVVRTEPRAEYLAADELKRDGYDIYLPRVTIPQTSGKRLERPLFPGYLFLRCDPQTQGWPTFRKGNRVSGWVDFGGVVPSLPDGVVTALMQRLETVNSQGGLWKRFRPGDRVRVSSNNLQSLAEVTEEAKSPQSRVKVLLRFMGRMISAQVPWEDLEAVEESPVEVQRAPRRTRGRGRWIQGFGPA